MQKHIALLGGTFDPVHNGHLRIAEIVLDELGFSQVIFIPNKTPPHRATPIATPQQRLKMLTLATQNNPNFIISHAELDRPGPSYMVDTLHAILLNHPGCCPWLILGKDAFAGLPTWHNFEKLTALCNFIIINRELSSPSDTQSNWSENYLKNNSITLDELNILTNTNKYRHNGSVILLNNTLITISGTQIRDLVKQTKTKLEREKRLQNYLPKQVVNYILDHNLYI